MSLFTSMDVGVLGLKAAQTALNTTSHNLANVYTEGYVRQTPVFEDKQYQNLNGSNKMQVGLGVYVAATSRVRDILLDQQYRTEVSKQGFYNEQYNAVTEVETFLGELEGTTFQDELGSLSEAINAVAEQPGSEVARSELVMNASSFLDRANAVYQSLIDYQTTLDTKVKDTVDQINKLGNTIYNLNKQISAIESPGIEAANDLRDQRDNALDQLASLVSISYSEDENSVVHVNVEGVPFVLDTGVAEMGTAQLNGADGSPYVTAVWPFLDNQKVFNLTTEISSQKGNDKGSLKGLLLARGDKVADYTDVPKRENYATDADYEAAAEEYNKTIDASVIMKAQALFDQLINGIVTKINDILSPTTTASFTAADGTVYTDVKVLDTANCSTGEDGTFPAEELFSRKYTDRYTEVTADDGTVYYVYNETNTFGNESLYTCGNLEINQTVLEDYTKLPYLTSENEIDMDMGQALLDAWSNPFSSIDPNNITEKNFDSYYNEFTYELANMGTMYQSISTNYGTSASSINDSRLKITGVSSDEELSDMIKYQAAYNASSRYITVIDQMLEHIIEKLG